MFDGTWTKDDWVIRIMTLVSLLLSIAIHEFGHAKMADYLGDDTPRRQGRVTLNPLAHWDPIGTLGMAVTVFMGFGLGWGKPVITNPVRYTKASMRVGRWWVTAAGPFTNIVIAVVCAMLIRFHVLDFDRAFLKLWAFVTMQVNLGLFFFNLLPVPPLDGSKLILPLFSNRVADQIERHYERYGLIMLVVLFVLRIPAMVLTPLITMSIQLLLGY